MDVILKHLFSYCLVVSLSFIGMYFLLTPLNRHLKIFYATSFRSKSGALLLGGLPIFLANCVGLNLLLTADQPFVLTWTLFASFLALGGWIDDSVELRARYKLFFQLASVTGFSVFSALHFNQPWFMSAIYFFFGMAVVNGTNLLDGLDTMSIKINSVVFLSFILLALINNNVELLTTSIVPLLTLLAFYPFNKWPSRLHLGEVGSSHLGFVVFFLGIYAYNLPGPVNINSIYLLPLLVSTSELAISFCRRLFAGRRPFAGDQLHLHHVLKSRFNLSAENTSTVYALFIALSMSISLWTARYSNWSPMFAFITFFAVGYSIICYKHWFSKEKKSNFFNTLLNEKEFSFIDLKIISTDFESIGEVSLAGLTFKGCDLSFLHDSNFKFIITVNAEYIVKAQTNPELHALINEQTSTLDGTIPYWLAKLANPKKKIDKISGSDLIYNVCEHAFKTGGRVFLLGGQLESNRGAIEKLREMYPGLEVEGFSPPVAPYPFNKKIETEIVTKIKEFKPSYMFVGFGIIKQEAWIKDHASLLKRLGARMAVGCGGTFDFVSGRIRRAPKFVQKIGLESLWRLVMEPKWFRVKRILTSFLVFRYALKSETITLKANKPAPLKKAA